MVNNHPAFLDRLYNSRHSVFVAAEWLSAGGYDVRIPAIKGRKAHEKIEDFVDDGDIFISKDGGPERRVEVKMKQFIFTTKDEYPYDSVLIANKASIDRIGDNLAAFILLSQDLETMLIAKAETRPHWKEVAYTAKNTGNLEHFYACDKSLLQFRKIRSEP